MNTLDLLVEFALSDIIDTVYTRVDKIYSNTFKISKPTNFSTPSDRVFKFKPAYFDFEQDYKINYTLAQTAYIEIITLNKNIDICDKYLQTLDYWRNDYIFFINSRTDEILEVPSQYIINSLDTWQQKYSEGNNRSELIKLRLPVHEIRQLHLPLIEYCYLHLLANANSRFKAINKPLKNIRSYLNLINFPFDTIGKLKLG